MNPSNSNSYNKQTHKTNKILKELLTNKIYSLRLFHKHSSLFQNNIKNSQTWKALKLIKRTLKVLTNIKENDKRRENWFSYSSKLNVCSLFWFFFFFTVAESFLKWTNFWPLQAVYFAFCPLLVSCQLLNFYWVFGCPFSSPKKIFSFLLFAFEVSFCTAVIYSLILRKDHIFSFQFALLHFSIASTPCCLHFIS